MTSVDNNIVKILRKKYPTVWTIHNRDKDYRLFPSIRCFTTRDKALSACGSYWSSFSYSLHESSDISDSAMLNMNKKDPVDSFWFH